MLLAALTAGHAQGQQTTDAAARQRLDLRPPPVDLGPPPVTGPRLLAAPAKPRDGCAPAWPCRLRLFGVIEKNGGVGLKAPAVTW